MGQTAEITDGMACEISTGPDRATLPSKLPTYGLATSRDEALTRPCTENQACSSRKAMRSNVAEISRMP